MWGSNQMGSSAKAAKGAEQAELSAQCRQNVEEQEKTKAKPAAHFYQSLCTQLPRGDWWDLKTLCGADQGLPACPAIHPTAQPCGQPVHPVLLVLWPSSPMPSGCPPRTAAGPAQQCGLHALVKHNMANVLASRSIMF